MKKRFICLAICAAMSIALLAACGESTTAPQTSGDSPVSPASPAAPSPTPAIPASPQAPEAPPEGVEFVEHLVILGGDRVPVIDTGNPAFNVSQAAWVLHMSFNTLVSCTIEGEYVPELATHWETDDYQTYTFKLRDDVYFHNGEKFTAADVGYTIDRAISTPGTRSFDRLNSIASYEIINDYEIEITLHTVNSEFIYLVAIPATSIVNQKAIEADPEKGPWIGTGKWIISDFISNESVLFVRNENYWDEIAVTESIDLRYVSEPSVRLIMLENGEAHAAYSIGATNNQYVIDDPRFDAKSFVMNNMYHIGFNQNDPLMADVNFRMAVAHAIDRDEMVSIVYRDFAIPLETGTFWGYATLFKNDDIPIIPYDLEKAQEYLAMTNYNGEEIEIVAAMADMIMCAQVVQAQLAKIGINVRVFETDSPGYSAYVAWGNTDAQMMYGSGGWSYSPIDSRPFYYPGAAQNRANYDNPEITALYDQIRITTDVAERERLYKLIQETVAPEVVYLGTVYQIFFVACLDGVDGLLLYPDMSHDLSGAYMIKQ